MTFSPIAVPVVAPVPVFVTGAGACRNPAMAYWYAWQRARLLAAARPRFDPARN